VNVPQSAAAPAITNVAVGIEKFWTEDVRQVIVAAEAMCDGFYGTRNALLGLWSVMNRAPSNIRDLYRGFKEEELESESAALDFDDLFDGMLFSAETRMEAEHLYRALAVRTRTLERLVLNLANGGSTRRAEDCLATFGNDQAYLLLRSPANRPAKTSDPFRRRGLRYSRLLPTTVRDFDVKLVFADDPRGRARLKAGNSQNFAACLFKDFEPEIVQVKGGFIVRDSASPQQIDEVRNHISESSQAACAGVVFPELTIGKGTLEGMAVGIREGSWDTSSISLIVAGSRHVDDGTGKVFNIATIFDGYGRVLAEQPKLFAYLDGPGPHEAIELGRTIHVFVFEDMLIAVGLCLDFCNLAETPPYLDLDVDIVAVPSCGSEKTILSHIRRSGDLLSGLKAKTMVVQQYHADKGDDPTNQPLGYVLVRNAKEEPTLDMVKQYQPWTVWKL
jgi:hypothetical protein